MKKYKIGNRVIAADSPIEAVKVAKLLDLDAVKLTMKDEYITQVGRRRYQYTAYGVNKLGFLKEIGNYDDRQRAINEAKKAKPIYNYDEVFVTYIGPDTQLKEKTIFTDSIKEDVVKASMKDVFNIERGATFKSKFSGDPWVLKVLKVDDDIVTYQTMQKHGDRFLSEHIEQKRLSNFKRLLESRYRQTNSIYDENENSEIEYLTKEEEQAVEDYRKAIAGTTNPKLLELYKHILDEELEHIRELENADIKDECEMKDSDKDSEMIDLHASYTTSDYSGLKDYMKQNGLKAYYIYFDKQSENKAQHVARLLQQLRFKTNIVRNNVHEFGQSFDGYIKVTDI